MGRVIAGVVAGFVVWSVLWLGGNALIVSLAPDSVGDDGSVTDPVVVGGVLALSVFCSLLAGGVCRLAGGRGAGRGPLALGVVLLAVGTAVQAMSWDLMPVWFHVAFLLLLVPVTLIGARVAGGRSAPDRAGKEV